MVSDNKSKAELIEELEELKKKYSSLKESYDLRTSYIRHTESHLLTSEQRYRTLIELAAEGILLGTKDGFIIEANKQLMEILGLPEEELIGKHISQLSFKKESIDKSPWRFDLIHNGETVTSQRTFVRPDGNEIIVEIHTRMMPDGTLQSLYLDITERYFASEKLKEKNEKIEAQNLEYQLINEKLNKINEELLVSKERAEESDKLKTAFLQNMSHEIRTPMNAIIGFSELMSLNLDDWAKIEIYSKMIINRSNDLLEIIEDILDISKIESGQLSIHNEDCNIPELFNELYIYFIEYRKRLFKEAIDLKIHIASDCEIKNINVDRIKLKQIFVNLISNSLKYTDSGIIEFGCKSEEGRLIFFVSDTGTGIEESKQNLIFERFFQLKQNHKGFPGGTGLGLSIVKGLLELMGGDIWLESEVNKGSTFYFSVLFKQINSSLSETTNSEKKVSTNFSGKSLLIVEDDYFNRIYLIDVLQPTGIKLFIAEDGDTAINKVRMNEIDIILMDIRLPDISGNDLTKKLLSINPDLKIIAQTAYAIKEESIASKEAGCVDFLSKPLKKDLLFYTIDKHLNGKDSI
jgi:PAS domain S-box-containing protein